MRIEISYSDKYMDGRAVRLARSLNNHGLGIERVLIRDIFLIKGLTLSTEQCAEVFLDPVAQDMRIDTEAEEAVSALPWGTLIEIAYLPGVTDTTALTAIEALKTVLSGELPAGYLVQTARQYLISSIPERPLSTNDTELLVKILHNPLIQSAVHIERSAWKRGSRPPPVYPRIPIQTPHKHDDSQDAENLSGPFKSNVPGASYNSDNLQGPTKIESYAIRLMNAASLMYLSKQRLLALSTDELLAVKEEFANHGFLQKRKTVGLSDRITDVEIEMIAQTWSEHCKHKIFNARIDYREGDREEQIDSIFKTYIMKTTQEIGRKKDYLKSVFHDNSGVIRFDAETLLCFKVETHNSPSALDPYGGAITGIVGVNRDIMGTGKGAKPIFNTNILCFGPPDLPVGEVPQGLLHPGRIMEGVHSGIIDGGNQSGIPVVGGAFLFDKSYIGKPLVFCGTGGILPSSIDGEEAWIGHIRPGDLAVMVGGRIGKDGIHGATFSSQALDKDSPTSAVQIGDPITQKKMLDFLLEARDRGLFGGITDNGAGGLSSSLGEMALRVETERGGVRIELDVCPLKYQGLAPWEILLSESQERMSLAVSPAKIDELLELAALRSVEATVVGEFTDTGFIEVRYGHKTVGLLASHFLHNGLPTMQLQAIWNPPQTVSPRIAEIRQAGRDLKADLLSVLNDPNVASKEELVRQYDHEVQARSVMGPFVGEKSDGPSDGAVLRIGTESWQGITVTHGICPRYGDYDTYHMAMCAVDEAYRAHIACGGDPDLVSALDNFCWPDPLPATTNPDAAFKLAQLVRACKGLREACLAYDLPLISGKDSMKNEAIVNGQKLPVRPTLLISLMGVIRDIRRTVSSDFKRAGDRLFILGETTGELGGTSYERLIGKRLGVCPRVRTTEAMACYRALSKSMGEGLITSCHDLSDGGLAVAACESSLAGRLGVEIDLDAMPGPAGDGINTEPMQDAGLLFCETPSRFLISAAAENSDRLVEFFEGLPFSGLGSVISDSKVVFWRGKRLITALELSEIEEAWKKWQV